MALVTSVSLGSTELKDYLSRFEAVPPRAKRQIVLNGGEESSPRAKGWHFKLTFGDSRYADDLALGKLLDALGATFPAQRTLVWTDHDGNSHTHTVQYDEQVVGIVGLAGLAETFTVELVEAP